MMSLPGQGWYSGSLPCPKPSTLYNSTHWFIVKRELQDWMDCTVRQPTGFRFSCHPREPRVPGKWCHTTMKLRIFTYMVWHTWAAPEAHYSESRWKGARQVHPWSYWAVYSDWANPDLHEACLCPWRIRSCTAPSVIRIPMETTTSGQKETLQLVANIATGQHYWLRGACQGQDSTSRFINCHKTESEIGPHEILVSHTVIED